MNYLFIHQNFPGQYLHLVRYLTNQPGNQVYFITQPNANTMTGVHKITYPKDNRDRVNCHAYTVEIDRAIHAAAAVADRCRDLRNKGFRPDLIVGHSGWGETLFVKDVFPDVPLLANFEFYYHSTGVDVGFDPEFVSIFQDPSRLRTRNATNLMAFEAADWGHSATRWQRSLYPPEMRPRISTLHEGVDTDIVRPQRMASFKLPQSERLLTRSDEVVTYVARNLEPYRGFHSFMRALPKLLRRRKRAEVVIVGGDGVSYGAPAPPRSTFKEMMLQEVGAKIDLRRVHFVGMLPYHDYLNLLQVSSAHVYLTYPFVLSWSFIEAMACGCLIVGSSTPPVLEVLRNEVNGLTVDFFSPNGIAKRIETALDQQAEMQRLRDAARATAVKHFDLKKVLLPRWNALFDDLLHGRRPSNVDGGSAPIHPPKSASKGPRAPARRRSAAGLQVVGRR
ncbi:MAG TPA: glycosyltransferase family 4 protein [Steroidobacteraceae bacterium]|nr:glycosyltransferase family 4 protein [Steroidobacteraceae bacterium]